MRTIHVALLTAVAILFGSVGTIRAQEPQPVMVGMPEYGVTLSGSPENPVLENHSGRVVIGYDMNLSAANGWGIILPAQIMAHSVLPAGIPDGGAIYVHGSVPVGFQGGIRVGAFSPGRGPIVRATLRSIVFGDGQFVGTDYQGAFELFGKQLKAVREVGVLPKRHAWVLIEAVAQLPSGGRPFPFMANYLMRSFRQVAVSLLMNGWHGWDALTAEFWGQGNNFAYDGLALRVLVNERRKKGDAAAAALAGIYSSLPTLWK